MSGMTGEAMPVERRAGVSSAKETALNHDNICLMVRAQPQSHSSLNCLITRLFSPSELGAWLQTLSSFFPAPISLPKVYG